MAHLAQTGHILRLKNRPGNVYGSRGAALFLRELIHEPRGRFGRGLPLEFRMDAAFFQEEILDLLTQEGREYAIKVGFWKWVNLRPLVAAHHKRVGNQTRKNFQLDLFSPDDGQFESSAVRTNKAGRRRRRTRP
ncbi:MAG: transposase [Candidatus Rokubacteria bacterium]|nr:transposase [Candidatus Rokubacteria bacterium]MBI3454451.1 transposase [Candidatus Rokubacteria bacterium]